MRSLKLCGASLVIILAAAQCLTLDAAVAQAGRLAAKAGGPAEDVVRDTSKHLRIKRIDWRSNASKVKAPDYVYNNSTRSSTKASPEWYVITTSYDTGTNWIDSLVVTYHVLVPGDPGVSKKDLTYMLCESTVTYLDVKQGMGHISTVYLRPTTIERYGEPVAVGVEISFNGENVAMSDFSPSCNLTKDARQSGKWWDIVKASRRVTVRDGYLLNRNLTPFIFANYNDEESIR